MHDSRLIIDFVIFRADASASLGGGHVMRCAALARAFSAARWQCAFAWAKGSAATLPRDGVLPASAVTLELNALSSVTPLKRRWPTGCDVLVVDAYHLDQNFERAARGWAQQIVVLDDLADRAHDADILVDAAPGRRAADYEVPASCRLLFGPRYALLAPPFSNAQAARPPRRRARRLLISLGLTDPGDLSVAVLKAIGDRFDIDIDVVVGPGCPSIASLRDTRARMHVGLSRTQMIALMKSTDVAIGAGGSSAWERCCIGLPTITIVAAQNQEHTANALHEACATIVVPDPKTAPSMLLSALDTLLAHPRQRHALATAAMRLCDGRGAARVLAAICDR